jgi:hypothetical protein
MPQLTRIRFCHVGHNRARMDDLILDFRDRDGGALHSVLWLRNGGGKSTILNLVFGLLRPDRRELFGSKAEQKNRHLEDYIQTDVPGVVVAEWQLDSASPDLYLTGVFYEKRSSGSSPDRLRRLFFAARVLPEEPHFTLEGLPISTQGERLQHRTLTNFKQEWHAIGQQHLKAEAKETEYQNDWQQILDAAGIDAELFGYQLQMNRQEGGAADLFKFNEIDEFVDFFLELAIDPSPGNRISSNLDGLREQLRRRQQEFIPERELINGTLERLDPLVGLYEKRETIDYGLAFVKRELDLLTSHLKDRDIILSSEIISIEQQEKTARQEVRRVKAEATVSQQRSIFFRYLAAQKQVKQLEVEHQELVKQDRQAQRNESIWKAAVPLQNLDRHTQKVKQLQKQIASQQVKHAPLLTQLNSAAQKYKAALLAKLEHLHQEEKIYTQTEQESSAKAIAARQDASGHNCEAARLEEQIKHVASQISDLARSHSKLEELGIVCSGETWINAEARLSQQQFIQTRSQQSIQCIVESLELEVDRHNERLSRLFRNESIASVLEDEIRTKLNNVRLDREIIEHDEYLLRYLDLAEIDLDLLDRNATIQLRQVEREIEYNVLNLWSGLLEQGQTIEYLEEHKLLPPSLDVRVVLEILEHNNVIAWSGWKFISDTVPFDRIRDFIQRLPEVFLGVIVQKDHYNKAKQVLSEVNPSLSTPIVLADRILLDRILSDDKQLVLPDLILLNNHQQATISVIGPSSDAYFNLNEARSEFHERKARCDREQEDLDNKKQELTTLRLSISRLERFKQQYPTEWMTTQQESIDRAIEKQRVCKAEIATIDGEQQRLKSEINLQRQCQHHLMEELASVREYIARLQEYRNRFPIELVVLKQNYDELVSEIKIQKEAADRCISNAEELEQQSSKASTEINKTVKQISTIDDTISRIKYCLDKSSISKAGNIQILCDAYEQLLICYERKVGANELNLLLENVKKDADEIRRKFTTKLTNGISEKVVRDALNSLLDGSDVERCCDDAVNLKFKVQGKLEKKKDELDGAQQKLALIEQQFTERDLTNEFGSFSREQLELKANEAELHAQALEANALLQNEVLQSTEMRQIEIRDCIKVIKHDLDKISLIFSGAQDLFQPIEDLALEKLAWIPPLDREVTTRVTTLQLQLTQIRSERKNLDSISNSVKHNIQKWIDDIQSNHGNIAFARRLTLWFEIDYERQCMNLQNDLNLRLQSVRDSLTELDRYRDSLVVNTLAAAKKGVDILKSLAKQSKLPPNLTNFSERSFLKIGLNDPSDLAERKSRIESLIDHIIDVNKVPSGIELLQQAVRRLAKPIRIDVLFPDPDSDRSEYIPITDMKKQSGGEYLTSAILIYCTLARVRAVERGESIEKTSTLLLDNPIGKASRPKFLELQREVARAMNIQLIFTTAVEDLEALSIFPNIIRLRNERQDPLTGEKLLEIDPGSRYLQASRLQIIDNRDNSET